MVAENKIESAIPLMERDIEAAQEEIKRDDDVIEPTPAATQVAARKKFLLWTGIKYVSPYPSCTQSLHVAETVVSRSPKSKFEPHSRD